MLDDTWLLPARRLRRKRPALTDADAAYAAAAWASGETQKSIGATFGYSSGAAISVEVGRFIEKYAGRRVIGTTEPNGLRGIYGEDRKGLVRDALAGWRAMLPLR